MRTFRHLARAAVVMLAAVPASAGPIVLGTSTHSGFTSMQPEAGGPQWAAQVFNLTATLDLADIELGFVHTVGFTSRVQLVRGGSPGAGITLFDTTFSDPAGPRLDLAYDSHSIALPMTLLPGSYYIVATNENSQDFGWSFGTTQIASTFGTIGGAFACLDANRASGCDAADPKASTEWFPLTDVGLPLDFRLVQQDPATVPDPVPEPATLLLFGGGLAGCAARFRKRLQLR